MVRKKKVLERRYDDTENKYKDNSTYGAKLFIESSCDSNIICNINHNNQWFESKITIYMRLINGSQLVKLKKLHSHLFPAIKCIGKIKAVGLKIKVPILL